MKKKKKDILKAVNEILHLKCELAGGRDFLQRILDHLELLVWRFELELKNARKKWYRDFLEEKIKQYGSTIKSITDSMQHANTLAKSPSNAKVMKTIVLFISSINELSKHSLLITSVKSKFKGLHEEFTAMIAHATKLMGLVATYT